MKHLFTILSLCLVFSLAPRFADPSTDIKFQKGDGVLTLYNLHQGEKMSVRYRDEDDHYIQSAIEQINHILRCRADNQVAEMSLSLIELVDNIQDHFHVDTVQVVSGYRTPDFNAHLRLTGHKVASRSRHMLGEAMDIRLPGISSRSVRDYAIALRVGGVGYYGGNNFVHVDVGPFRTW